MNNTFEARGAGRFNNFDFLRLLFAATVLFSHCFSVTFAGDALDPIHRLSGGRLGSGPLTVDAFFIISGYLITASWINRPQIGSFLRNRFLRIFPAYAVVCLFCAFVVAPLGGAKLHHVFGSHAVIDNLMRTLALSTPRTVGAFAEMHKPDFLDGSLWTIRNEFLCYLLVMVLGCLNLFRHRSRKTVARLCGIALLGYAIHSQLDLESGHWNFPVLGDLNAWPRLLSCYLCGMVFRLYRERIPYSAWLAAASVTAIIVSLPLAATRAIIVPTAGAYLLFYVAFNPALPLQRVGAIGDFSYGLYLYGWPIQQLLLHYLNPQLSPYALFPLALISAGGCAVLSWKYIEQPMMKRKAKALPTIIAEPRLPWMRPRPMPISVQIVFGDNSAASARSDAAH